MSDRSRLWRYPWMLVDREAGAAYVELRDRGGRVASTVQLGYGISVDLDEDGVPLGYEILHLPTTPDEEPA